MFIEKTCPEHGYFRDCINPTRCCTPRPPGGPSRSTPGRSSRRSPAREHCPSDCGLCNQHQSGLVPGPDRPDQPLQHALPDLLRQRRRDGRGLRADLRAGRRGSSRPCATCDPSPCTAIQFTGGEPTIHPRLPADRLDRAATWASRTSRSPPTASAWPTPDFAARRAEAGLHTLYLQFDGVGEEPYRRTRNYPGIWEKKLAGHGELPRDRHEGLPGADDPQGRQRRPGGRDLPLRRREHRRRQRHQLPAGLASPAGSTPQRAGRAALHPGRPGPRHRRGLRRAACCATCTR